MNFELKLPIYGFDYITNIELKVIDDNIIQIMDENSSDTPFLTLINPFNLKDDYTFDIPNYFRSLLEINNEENLLVYCVVIILNPISKSKVNFLAPFIFNLENNRAGQLILDTVKYSTFGLEETVEDYL